MAGSLMNKVWDFFGMEVEDEEDTDVVNTAYDEDDEYPEADAKDG